MIEKKLLKIAQIGGGLNKKGGNFFVTMLVLLCGGACCIRFTGLQWRWSGVYRMHIIITAGDNPCR
jgi:hypothetical protein